MTLTKFVLLVDALPHGPDLCGTLPSCGLQCPGSPLAKHSLLTVASLGLIYQCLKEPTVQRKLNMS